VRAAVYDRLGPAHEVLRVVDLDRPSPPRGRCGFGCVSPRSTPPTTRPARRHPASPCPSRTLSPTKTGPARSTRSGRASTRRASATACGCTSPASAGPHGTAAQWMCLPERQAVALPEAVGFDLGASLGIPALTAHRAVFSDGPITGQTILVAGGAGRWATSPSSWPITPAPRSSPPPLTAESRRRGGGRGRPGRRLPGPGRGGRRPQGCPRRVDRIVEVALGANLQLDLAVLARSGTIVTYGADGPDPHIPVRDLMVANVTLRFLLIYGVPEPALRQAVADVTTALANGALTELPAHRYGLDEIAAAHEAAEAGAIGKVLIDIDG
jgi:NADPH:quinone reductase